MSVKMDAVSGMEDTDQSGDVRQHEQQAEDDDGDAGEANG